VTKNTWTSSADQDVVEKAIAAAAVDYNLFEKNKAEVFNSFNRLDR
jgi:hypothetical protein